MAEMSRRIKPLSQTLAWKKHLRTVAALLLSAAFLLPTMVSERSKEPSHQPTSVDRELRPFPKLPSLKLSISRTSPTSAWCDFVSYTLSHMTPEMFLDRHHASSETDKLVLLIDDRYHLGHFWTIPWTLNLLGPDWGLQILTKETSAHFYRKILDHYAITNAKVDTFEDDMVMDLGFRKTSCGVCSLC